MSGTNGTPKKIIDVAVDLFAANGFKGTSIRDIAKTSGTTISNIYYYFGNKEGLLTAILDLSTREIVEKLRQAAKSDIEPLERFKLLLGKHLSLLLDEYRKEAKILFLEEEHISRINKQFQLDILNMYREELQNLQSLGYIDYKNLTILAFNIFGVIDWHLRWYKPEGRLSLKEINDEMITFVLHGTLSHSRSENRLKREP